VTGNNWYKPLAMYLILLIFFALFAWCQLIPSVLRPRLLICALQKDTLFVVSIVVCCMGMFPRHAVSQLSTRWQIHANDCQMQGGLIDHRMALDSDFHLNECEVLEFTLLSGSSIVATYSFEPAQIIPEFIPEVWLKSNREGIQLSARVVLPYSKSPNNNGPITVWIAGPKSTRQDQWQHLSYSDLKFNFAESFSKYIWALRERHGPNLDTSGAYVDQLKLDLFDGPGKYKIAIGKVNLLGATRFSTNDKQPNLDNFSDAQPATWLTHSNGARRDGTVLEVDGKPFFARMIQHNGEPFEILREIGFNTVQLRSTATEEQLASAKANDLWIVCPPPPAIGLQPLGFGYQRVLAWDVGNQLQSRDVRRVEQTVKEIKASDPNEDRPIFVNVQASWSDFVRSADILSVGLSPLGSTFPVNQYGSWIQSRSALANNRLPVFADIQTEVNLYVSYQSLAFSGQVLPIPISKDQMQCVAFEAISGGARGLRFTSRTRIDSNDLATQLRRQTLTWLLAQLKMFEPWVAGGALEGPTSTRDRNLKITSIKTSRARLFLLQRTTGREQWVAGEEDLKKIVFDDLNTATQRAYLINEMGILPLAPARSHAGATIAIDDCPQNAAIVLTQDPLVINRLSGNVADQNTMIFARRDITRNWIAIEQLVLDQLTQSGVTVPVAAGALREAELYYEQAERLIRTGSRDSFLKWSDKADQRLALTRWQILENARSGFLDQGSPPLLSHVALVPQHWQTVRRLSGQSWRGNALPGGDFESLQQLLDTGWNNQKWGIEKYQSLVELAPSAARAGKTGLRMVVQPAQYEHGQIIVENTPVWITSAPIRVKTGQMIRIQGWVNVPAAISGSHDGAMIIDSVGGAELAPRFLVTNGWQEFAIYRAVLQDTDLRLTFAMTGIGQAYFDEVTVRTIDLPMENVRRAAGPVDTLTPQRSAQIDSDNSGGENMLRPLAPKLGQEIR
jgi:hypothetical protein